ncbi:hypothetical protein [Streptomyces gilvosporeus]|uniref:hypothetical protein n=1 Tax=Streptomyces gilvosporeus TaxID=553510 RepID=UPI00131C04F4|nr:hypothetical protein [Streptomyces gilvosporeus]
MSMFWILLFSVLGNISHAYYPRLLNAALPGRSTDLGSWRHLWSRLAAALIIGAVTLPYLSTFVGSAPVKCLAAGGAGWGLGGLITAAQNCSCRGGDGP